jgi:hypothetical protein
MSENSIPSVSTGRPVSLSGLVSIRTVRAALVFLLCVSYAMVVLTAVLRPMNGDEAIFLSDIHRTANGWDQSLLQTVHTHLFWWWLPHMGLDEVGQTIIGRTINVVLWAASLVLLHRLGRHLLDPLGALVGVVLFAVFLYSVASAADFRIDGLVLPVLLSVALLLLNPTTGRVAAAGALSAVALALTIKAVLWAPAFVGVLAVGLWHRQKRLRPILWGTLTLAGTYAGIMLAHRWAIATGSDPEPGIPIDRLAGIGSYMLFDGLFPQPLVLGASLLHNPVTWTLIAIGSVLAVASLREPKTRGVSLKLLFLAFPLTSVAFYTNAFPYAYLVLIPTACLLAGKAFSRFMGTGEGVKGVTALLALVGVAIPMTLFASWELREDHTKHQRRVLSAVHQLFDEPVPYFDLGGMLASFPRPRIAITRAVLSGYRRAGVPVVANYIRDSAPPLLIVNSPSLDMWTDGKLDEVDPDVRLLPQDEEALRATYAHYWSQIYLAGRQWSDLGAGERRAFEIVVPGDHTLLAENAVTVDGRTYAPGATIALEAGPHELRTTAAEPDLRILWGKDLKLPSEDGQI